MTVDDMRRSLDVSKEREEMETGPATNMNIRTMQQSAMNFNKIESPSQPHGRAI